MVAAIMPPFVFRSFPNLPNDSSPSANETNNHIYLDVNFTTHHTGRCDEPSANADCDFLVTVGNLLVNPSRHLSGRGLSSRGTATVGSAAATTRLASESTTAAALAAGATALEATTATASGTATSSGSVVATSEGSGLGATLLNNNVLAINGVGVGGNGGIITGLGLELDESAVLKKLSVPVDIKQRHE